MSTVKISLSGVKAITENPSSTANSLEGRYQRVRLLFAGEDLKYEPGDMVVLDSQKVGEQFNFEGIDGRYFLNGSLAILGKVE